MLNYFYTYATYWFIVIILYNIKITSLNTPLEMQLIVFFIITACLSLIYGKAISGVLQNCFRNNSKIIYNRKVCSIIVTSYVLFFLIECYFSGAVPLWSIVITGTTKYFSIKTIPFFHALFVSCSYAYFIYLFYIYLNTKDRVILINCLLLQIVNLLYLNRGQLLLSCLAAVLLFMHYKFLRSRHRIKILCTVMVIVTSLLYVFGGLGNLRSSQSWNDDHIITAVGKYREEYSNYIPGQFKWAYTYITSPLANLNFNVSNQNIHRNFIAGFFFFIPDFIAKRINPSLSRSHLLIDYRLNVCGGLGDVYVYLGILGMYVYYFYTIIIMTFLVMLYKKDKFILMPSLAIMNVMIIFQGFENPWFDGEMVTQLFFLFLIYLLHKLKQIYIQSNNRRF